MHTIYWRPKSNDVQGLFSKKKNSERFITTKAIISVHICQNKASKYLSIEHAVRTLDVEMDDTSLHTVFEALQVICNKVNNVSSVVKAAKKTKISSLLKAASTKKIVKSN